VTDHEIISTVIRTVPLLWHVQTFQFLAEVKTTGNGKLAQERWLNCALMNSMWLIAVIQIENYQHRHKRLEERAIFF
jgi:hypothetical protein